MSEGFTLSEVLITLGIIGVLAALTIPSLMNNVQDTQYKSAYKKAYSTVSQAFTKATADGDIGPMTGTCSSQGTEANFVALKNQFKVVKSCTNSQTGGCWNTTGEPWRSENPAAPGFIDSSGIAWKLRALDSGLMVSTILVDTNGNKKPNEYGKDRFVLLFANKNGAGNPGMDDYAVHDMGIPTKIMPLGDIPKDAAAFADQCPSYQKHACYFSTWLMN